MADDRLWSQLAQKGDFYSQDEIAEAIKLIERAVNEKSQYDHDEKSRVLLALDGYPALPPSVLHLVTDHLGNWISEQDLLRFGMSHEVSRKTLSGLIGRRNPSETGITADAKDPDLKLSTNKPTEIALKRFRF